VIWLLAIACAVALVIADRWINDDDNWKGHA